MSKELFVTSTPHETKLAVVEDDQLVEVFFERENEYTLAGSIYKGKVTRVLPGMQSAFVDIGLERDAFLYVTDFLEEVETDDDDVATAPAASGEQQAQSSEAGEDGGPREERGGRQERGGRGRGGRGRGRGQDRGGRRPEQHRAAQASEAESADEIQKPLTGDNYGNFEAAPAEAVEAAEVENGNEEQQTQTPQPSGDRLPRRWRGRRGRRRGRSFLNESKYEGGEEKADGASQGERPESVNAEEADGDIFTETSHEVEREAPLVLEHDASGDHHAQRQETEAHERDHAKERESREHQGHEQDAREQAPQEREARAERHPEPKRAPQRPQRILLPGESLAKYNPRPEAAADEKKSEVGAASTIEGRFQKVAPRPSTEVSVTTASLSAGVLAGESIAKYRNRPAPAASETREERKTEVAGDRHESRHEESRHEESREEELEDVPHAHKAADPEGYDVHAAHVSAEKHRHEPEVAQQTSGEHNETEQHDGQTQHAQPENERGIRGEYNFSPGSGVIEEEEIAEEEHEALEDDDEFEDQEFEELEEETLEEDENDPHEKHILAASEGLAAALMENRDPTKVKSYGDEDEEEDEDDEDEESAKADEHVGSEDFENENESEVEEPEEAFTLEGGYDGPDVAEPEVDPEDPNYSGRAETRGPSTTAGYQQRTERTDRGSERGFDRGRRGNRRGGGRPQRGGRPMRGGPRRNIPRGPMPQINELLKEGQEILVQIAKEPMAKKGARITSHIALPGRFLVFMPTVNHTGVSRKIGSEEERHRLKRILISEKGTSHGGFIVRTAAAGASEEDLRADIRFLINLWGEIKQRAETSKAPALIYHDLNLVERILRDQVTTTFSQIWVDNENEYERILRFASRFQPSLVRRVKLYSKEIPLFEEFTIQDEINKALKSKVWLKSGGYIVINQTEALVAIDINTGKYVGKTTRLEDTIVKTNIDAIKEIVRQIRLRDLGGIIVIDFIDMDERKNRQRVMQALEEALKSDRSPSKVLQFNDFGLVAITRKRVKQSLERTLGTQCTYCTGTGMIKSVATVCNEIYVELRKMSKHFDNHQITLRVNPEVGKALKENGGRWLLEMEELTKKTILVKNDPAQHQEQFDIH